MDNKDCEYCTDCWDCHECEWCVDCVKCFNCDNCNDCVDCSHCENVLNGNDLQEIWFLEPTDCKGLTQEQAEAKMREEANG